MDRNSVMQYATSHDHQGWDSITTRPAYDEPQHSWASLPGAGLWVIAEEIFNRTYRLEQSSSIRNWLDSDCFGLEPSCCWSTAQHSGGVRIKLYILGQKTTTYRVICPQNVHTHTHTHTHRPDTDYDREVDCLGGVTRGMTYRFDARNSASYLNFQFEQWGFLLHSRLSLNFRFECSGLDKETSVDTGGRAGLPCLALVVNHVSHQKFTIRIYKFYAVTVAVKQGSMTN